MRKEYQIIDAAFGQSHSSNNGNTNKPWLSLEQSQPPGKPGGARGDGEAGGGIAKDIMRYSL